MKSFKIVIPILFFINCLPIYRNATASKSDNITVNYCEEYIRLEKHRDITDETNVDSSNAYYYSMINCLRNNILQHNNDSLTIDSCLCHKRLQNVLTIGYDSAFVLVENVNAKKIVTIRPKDPNMLDGIQRYEIDDSCRILGFDKKIKAK